jgi:selenium-binding protein 1
VQLLDISNLDKVKVLTTLKLPKLAGPHATVLAPDNRTVAISTYYVQHPSGVGYTQPFTNVNERSIRLYKVSEDGNSFAPHPVVHFIDFKSMFPHRVVARPHGMAFRPVAAKT